jgi:hypothetical protein
MWQTACYLRIFESDISCLGKGRLKWIESVKSAVPTEKASIMRTNLSSSFSANRSHLMIYCTAAGGVTVSPSVPYSGALGLLIW